MARFARTVARIHLVDEAEDLDRRIAAALLDVCSPFPSATPSDECSACARPPIGRSAVPVVSGTVAWYFGPTRVAARGKMRSSGSTTELSKRSPGAHEQHTRTEGVFRKRVQPACVRARPGQLPRPRTDRARKRQAREGAGGLTRSTGRATS